MSAAIHAIADVMLVASAALVIGVVICGLGALAVCVVFHLTVPNVDDVYPPEL